MRSIVEAQGYDEACRLVSWDIVHTNCTGYSHVEDNVEIDKQWETRIWMQQWMVQRVNISTSMEKNDVGKKRGDAGMIKI